jgi:hypothetical protein
VFIACLSGTIATYPPSKTDQALVEVSRIKVGERQTIETLINEEALQLAKYLRSEHEI